MIGKLSFVLLSFVSVFARLCAAADTPLWEPAKVVSVEQVSSPAKEPDPSCRAVPRGATLPARCRASNLRAQQYWRVTVDVGNKRFVVRPYRAPNLLDALNQDAPDYVDPQLTPASSLEAAVVSSKTIRLRTDQGSGIPAIVDSQELLSRPVPKLYVDPPAPRSPQANVPVKSASKVVLLDNSDFVDLEVQEAQSQDIGDGAALFSFTGDASPVRAGSDKPVFLVLADSQAAMPANVELSRLQVGQGSRQLAYSLAKKRSASSLPIDDDPGVHYATEAQCRGTPPAGRVCGASRQFQSRLLCLKCADSILIRASRRRYERETPSLRARLPAPGRQDRRRSGSGRARGQSRREHRAIARLQFAVLVGRTVAESREPGGCRRGGGAQEHRRAGSARRTHRNPGATECRRACRVQAATARGIDRRMGAGARNHPRAAPLSGSCGERHHRVPGRIQCSCAPPFAM